MVRTSKGIGRTIRKEEETKLLDGCRVSRSRPLLPVVALALSTAMRYSELRCLRWASVNLAGRSIVRGQGQDRIWRGPAMSCGVRVYNRNIHRCGMKFRETPLSGLYSKILIVHSDWLHGTSWTSLKMISPFNGRDQLLVEKKPVRHRVRTGFSIYRGLNVGTLIVSGLNEA